VRIARIIDRLDGSATRRFMDDPDIRPMTMTPSACATMIDTPLRRAAAVLLCAAALLTHASPTLAIEEPAHTVVERDGRIELRDYAPTIVAETVVDGDLSSASNRGFRAIAAYIFGANRSVRAAGSEKIEMTAPVAVESASEKIAMTAPVSAERQGGDALSGEGTWTIRFTMPASYTLATLPRPNDASVTLREVPGGRYAVLVFSGFTGEDKVRANTAELLAWMGTKGFKPAGAPQLARYDPPWQLPFMRRNEIVVPVAR
jgi:hypothetical protein